MKKLTVIFVISVLLLFVGASPWEGAAAAAPDGILPVTGHYVATNSFPRNTVVEITNIETNQTTKAVVAGTLDSPGLLAVVSREAAESIGMRQGSISRVRMVQPSDPVAYLRFIEGMGDVYIPEFLPEYGHIVIAQEDLTDEVFLEENDRVIIEDRPVVIAQQGAENGYVSEVVIEETAEEVIPSVNGITGPSYVVESEWLPSPAIVDPPVFIPVIPVEHVAEDETKETPEHIAEAVEEGLVEEETPEYIAEAAEEGLVEEETPEYVAEAVEEGLVEEEVPEYVAEAVEEEVIEETPEYIAEAAPEWEPAEYNIVPSEERPPAQQSIYGIDFSQIIPEIVSGGEPTIPQPASEAVAQPTAEVVQPPQRESFSPHVVFSVPRVSELARGSYYVQIAALNTPELVENALRNIDHNFNPLVLNTGDNLYRILLGPLNQGESAAVLQRFRSIGYTDAFIRQAR